MRLHRCRVGRGSRPRAGHQRDDGASAPLGPLPTDRFPERGTGGVPAGNAQESGTPREGEERLHPLEVVDAALAYPAFAQLTEEADFLRTDTGYITYVPESDRWYVGSCSHPEDIEIQYWRLAAVEPVSGEVLELIYGFGNETCDPGTWPVSTSPWSHRSRARAR